ncbi:hypothetical protein BTUL_0040g00360 [Botrytis tulipae]|uniref:Uncharacterized protein n=1 Tax=Botrytis tulipae TaxID=87230 RepID=A0A4Z1EWI1_9HELO|nr:hypothetical protein BTUL_0040g00360 [Botrytis tulipae]
MLPLKAAQAPAAAAKTRYANFFLAAGQAPVFTSSLRHITSHLDQDSDDRRPRVRRPVHHVMSWNSD